MSEWTDLFEEYMNRPKILSRRYWSDDKKYVVKEGIRLFNKMFKTKLRLNQIVDCTYAKAGWCSVCFADGDKRIWEITLHYEGYNIYPTGYTRAKANDDINRLNKFDIKYDDNNKPTLKKRLY